MLKKDLKKVPIQKKKFAPLCKYMIQLFTKKKSHFTTPLMERATYDFNLEKIAPLHREIGKKKLHLLNR